MDDFFGLGGLMGQQQPALSPAAPEKEAAWKQYLTNPTVQAAIFNMGVSMMQPKWNQGSVLPDALSAGAGTVAKQEQEDYARNQVEQEAARKSGEAAANRENAMGIAKLNADSRMDVAQARMAAMLEAVNTKASLRGPAGTPHEQKFYGDVYKQALNEMKLLNDSAVLTKRPLIPEAEMQQRATERAQQALQDYRLQFAPGPNALPRQGATAPPTQGTGPAVPGEITRQNPTKAPPQQGMVPAPQAPKITSPNPTNTPPPNVPATAGQYTSEALIGALQKKSYEEFAGILEDPAKIASLRGLVKDPEVFDLYINKFGMSKRFKARPQPGN